MKDRFLITETWTAYKNGRWAGNMKNEYVAPTLGEAELIALFYHHKNGHNFHIYDTCCPKNPYTGEDNERNVVYPAAEIEYGRIEYDEAYSKNILHSDDPKCYEVKYVS